MSAKLPWNKDREELQKMKTQKKVLDGLTPLQRKKPETIRHGHRQAIANRAGVVSTFFCLLLSCFVLVSFFPDVGRAQSWLGSIGPFVSTLVEE